MGLLAVFQLISTLLGLIQLYTSIRCAIDSYLTSGHNLFMMGGGGLLPQEIKLTWRLRRRREKNFRNLAASTFVLFLIKLMVRTFIIRLVVLLLIMLLGY